MDHAGRLTSQLTQRGMRAAALEGGTAPVALLLTPRCLSKLQKRHFEGPIDLKAIQNR